MIIHVRNFGKIESADIDMSNFTIFVGENNSGKTYLMQLIYGVIDFLINFKDSFISDVDIWKTDSDFSTIEADDEEFLTTFQDCVNKFLDDNKEKIIEKIFHTKNITIESLFVDLSPLQYDYNITLKKDEKLKDVYKTYNIRMDNISMWYTILDNVATKSVTAISAEKRLSKLIILNDLGIAFNFRHNYNPMIYLPASRSGIMLLYANYLANNMKTEISVVYENEEKPVENEYGVTEPVYDFLMFLLKHKDSEILEQYKGEILDFINKYIIHGSLAQVGNTMRYTPESSDGSIPIYLSSSLVSELAPICQVLSGINNIQYILYDEIETCQHPTKQLQLARMLIRMVNAGYKMIVSTHSDTMAAAINNLITLSYKKDSKKLAEELGYTEDDLLKNSDIHAYQFKIDKVTGKTKVEEIPSHFSLGIGFDFDIFNKTNDKIYQDAVKLAEVD